MVCFSFWIAKSRGYGTQSEAIEEALHRCFLFLKYLRAITGLVMSAN